MKLLDQRHAQTPRLPLWLRRARRMRMRMQMRMQMRMRMRMLMLRFGLGVGSQIERGAERSEKRVSHVGRLEGGVTLSGVHPKLGGELQ